MNSAQTSRGNRPPRLKLLSFMKFVYQIDSSRRYRFPTHVNDLVIDRSDAAASEVFLVVLERGEAPPLHKHDDAEQIFHVLEGEGILCVGSRHEEHAVRAGDVVRIPPSVLHSIRCSSQDPLRYLAIDCFLSGPPPEEPTWDDHARLMCKTNNWDYHKVVENRQPGA